MRPLSITRPLLVRRALPAMTAGRLLTFAVIGIGTDEHSTTRIVSDDFIEIGILRTAQRARRIEAVSGERVVLEIKRFHPGMRRDRINALLAPGAEQLQGWTIVHLG